MRVLEVTPAKRRHDRRHGLPADNGSLASFGKPGRICASLSPAWPCLMSVAHCNSDDHRTEFSREREVIFLDSGDHYSMRFRSAYRPDRFFDPYGLVSHDGELNGRVHQAWRQSAAGNRTRPST